MHVSIPTFQDLPDVADVTRGRVTFLVRVHAFHPFRARFRSEDLRAGTISRERRAFREF